MSIPHAPPHVPPQEPPHDDLLDRGLAVDLHTMVSRRRALLVLGGLGAGALLAACGGGGSSTPTTAPTTTPTTGTADSEADSTADSIADSGTGATAGSTDGSACVDEIPQETAGPYPGDGTNGVNALTEDGIVRSDITASFGASTTVADGIPTEIVLTIVGDDGCTPVSGAAVYAWHCDAAGNYSLYSEAAVDENYLRGVQETAADGSVRFTTIFPGCYSGRWPHVHVEVFESLEAATTGRNSVATSQLAFPQDVCETAYADPRYPSSAGNLSRLSLESDNIFGDDGGVHQLASMSGDPIGGYVAALTVGL